MTEPVRLSLLTFENSKTPEPAQHDCVGYTCPHPDCQAERDVRASLGVARRQPIPFKRAA